MNLEKVTKIFFNLLDSVLSLVKIIILSKYPKDLKNIKIDTKECIILGNGPSLTDTIKKHLKFLKSQPQFCVNHFAFSDYYTKIKPKYYVLTAPEFWLTDATDWHKEQRLKLINALTKNTSWAITLFIPFAAKKSELWNTLSYVNPNIKVVYFNNTPIEGFKTLTHFFFKKNLGLPRPYNVLIPTIFLALNIGYKNVLITGADHSWHEEIKVDKNNSVSVNHAHFYDDGKKMQGQMYKLDGKAYYLHDVFKKLHLAFKGYFILKNYAKVIGAEIINVSEKSYIDAFPRGKIKQ